MESKAFRRLQNDVDKLRAKLRQSAERQAQLSAALGKSREELERLRIEVQRYKTERNDTKKQVESLVKRFEKLDINWDRAGR